MSKVKSHLRGGARAGAGRPPKKDKRVQLSTTVTPETMERLRAVAMKEGTSIGRTIDELCRKK